MAVNTEAVKSWTFITKAEPSPEMLSILISDEEILVCYQTVRDQAVLTNKRIIIFDRQGMSGKKIEIYSLPYRSIDMWSTENAGQMFDFNAELELWTRAGHFKISVNRNCDIREFDRILGNAILENK